jgi:hypothetical protein
MTGMAALVGVGLDFVAGMLMELPQLSGNQEL